MFLDALPVEMEVEFHDKMENFLSSNIDGSDNPYNMNLSESTSSCAANVDIPSNASSDMLGDTFDTTLDATNEKLKPK